MDRYYRIADLTVKMNSFGRTVQQAEAYEISPVVRPDIEIVSTWENKKKQYPWLSDDDGEYLATGSDFYKNLLNFQGFMLHASAVVVDGGAYLFSADSGTGKSTHTEMWLDRFGSQAFILNDDKPALRLRSGKWYAYGTPWSGKHDISVNIGVPIVGIAMLHRGETNEIYPWKDPSLLPSIIKQVNRPREKEYREKLLNNLDQLVEKVPIWKLVCNRNLDAVTVAYTTMSGENYKERTNL